MMTIVSNQIAQQLYAAQQWWNMKSVTFTALCGTEGDEFTHGDVVKANAYLLFAMIIIGCFG